MNTTPTENQASESSVLASDIAHNLESTVKVEREELWASLSAEQQGEALPLVNKALTSSLLQQNSVDEVAEIAKHMAPKDIVEIIEAVPNSVAADLLDNLDSLDKQRVEENLQYPEGTVGRFIGYAVITMREDRDVSHVLEFIRNKKLPAFTDMIYLIGKKRRLEGAITLATLLEAPIETKIGELQRVENLVTLDPNTSKHDAVTVFRQRQLTSAPVVDSDQKLLGRVTFDKILDVVTQEANQQVLNMAGLNEDLDLFSPVLPSAKRRAVWLGINLLTAIAASWAIGLFSATLEQVVALAILMPIVASMGGIAGSQTLTLTIRGLALDKVNKSNRRALLTKEVGVALLNGLLWSLVVGIVVFFWFSDIRLSAVITLAIFGNSVMAAFTGWAVPLVLNSMKIDPAIAGSVVLTTFTDIVGFVLFLGLGTLWLL